MFEGDGKAKVGPGASEKVRRLLSLDVLRAVAVLLVLFSHAFDPPRTMLEFIRKPIVLLDHVGWIGVDLFFVLSGFLVSGLLFKQYIKHGQIRVGSFYARRALKIYPALYFLVIVSIVLQNGVFDDPPPLKHIAGDLLFLQNYVGAIWGHTWSLAVEEHFYLLLPPALLLLTKMSKNIQNPFELLPKVVLVVAVVELGLRIYMNIVHDYSHGSHLFASHLRFDSLLFGVLISYFYHYHYDDFVVFVIKWRVPTLVVVSIMLAPILLLLRENPLVSTIGVTLVYLLAGIVLCWALTLPNPKHWSAATLGFIGVHSYSIYLWHYPVTSWVMEPMQSAGFSWFSYTSTYLVVSLVLGVLMAKLVEFPILHLRDKWLREGRKPEAKVMQRIGGTKRAVKSSA